jgi:hypothetical protein
MMPNHDRFHISSSGITYQRTPPYRYHTPDTLPHTLHYPSTRNMSVPPRHTTPRTSACQPQSIGCTNCIPWLASYQRYHHSRHHLIPTNRMGPKKRPAAADSVVDNNHKKRPASASEVADDTPNTRQTVTPPACVFANWFTRPDMTMNMLLTDIRTQLGAPQTKIRVVTALLGSTSPVPTLIAMMPEVTYVATAVYSKTGASPALVSFPRGPDHVYISLPVDRNGGLCLRHACHCHPTPNNTKASLGPRQLASHGPDPPHILMCDKAALDAKLPNIAARLVGIICCDCHTCMHSRTYIYIDIYLYI